MIPTASLTDRRPEHGLDPDTDRCHCGAEVVYFEDPDLYGWTGTGCESAGVWWALGLDVCRHHGRQNCPACEDE